MPAHAHARDAHAETRQRGARTCGAAKPSYAPYRSPWPPPHPAAPHDARLRGHGHRHRVLSACTCARHSPHNPGLPMARGESMHSTYTQTAPRTSNARIFSASASCETNHRALRRACTMVFTPLQRGVSYAHAPAGIVRGPRACKPRIEVRKPTLRVRRPGVRTTRLHPHRHRPAAPSALPPHHQRCAPPLKSLRQAGARARGA